MLRSLDELRGYTLAARDGSIGKAHDFLIDDERWVVRYLVADTARWLPGRRVLVSPLALGKPDWAERRLDVDLTRDKIEHGPSIDLDAPVSRRHEQELSKHHGWPIYWGGPGVWGPYPLPHELVADRAFTPDSQEDPEETRLRSVKEVTGYHIRAEDGRIGHVEDFIADTGSWAVRFMVVDTRNWLPGPKVLVSPNSISSVDWGAREVSLAMTKETVEKGPRYDAAQPVNRQFVERFYDFHGRPRAGHHADR